MHFWLFATGDSWAIIRARIVVATIFASALLR
jgi:hypothetical protein